MPYVLRRPATAAVISATTLAAALLAVPQQAEAAGVRVHDIQGSTRVSPLRGQRVTDVPGTVTAVQMFGSSRGFWLQDTEPDDDPATSEGIFIFTGSTTPAVKVGDSVLVSGTVSEFYPGGVSAGGQSLTELSSATWTVSSGGQALPAAFRLDEHSLPNRYTPEPNGTIEPLTLQPDTYALDRLESLEGMRVTIDNGRVVGPSNEFNEVWLTARPQENPTVRGGTLYGSYAAQNPGRVKVTSLLPFADHPFPQANVGDVLTGATAGPLDYDQFGGYTIRATALGERQDNQLEVERTRPQKAAQLAVATYNVENLSPKDSQAKFDRLARAVVDNLASPDVLTLEEIQDDTGATNNGVVSAETTLRRFTEAVHAAGGPAYTWRQIDPVNDQDGGQPGGNIRVAFLFNPDRVSFVDRPGGDAITPVSAVRVNGRAALSVSPGRVAPADPAWTDSRKPLVGEFVFRGRTVFIIANHFNSKGGDQGLDSRFQPPARSSEVQRGAQATVLHGFVDDLLAIDPKANVIASGDFNDFSFSPALTTLTGGGGLVDLMTKLPAGERYSYDFNGNSQTLDHILTSAHLAANANYDVVHINAEFADQASDHDPQVVRVRPKN